MWSVCQFQQAFVCVLRCPKKIPERLRWRKTTREILDVCMYSVCETTQCAPGSSLALEPAICVSSFFPLTETKDDRLGTSCPKEGIRWMVGSMVVRLFFLAPLFMAFN